MKRYMRRSYFATRITYFRSKWSSVYLWWGLSYPYAGQWTRSLDFFSGALLLASQNIEMFWQWAGRRRIVPATKCIKNDGFYHQNFVAIALFLSGHFQQQLQSTSEPQGICATAEFNSALKLSSNYCLALRDYVTDTDNVARYCKRIIW